MAPLESASIYVVWWADRAAGQSGSFEGRGRTDVGRPRPRSCRGGEVASRKVSFEPRIEPGIDRPLVDVRQLGHDGRGRRSCAGRIAVDADRSDAAARVNKSIVGGDQVAIDRVQPRREQRPGDGPGDRDAPDGARTESVRRGARASQVDIPTPDRPRASSARWSCFPRTENAANEDAATKPAHVPQHRESADRAGHVRRECRGNTARS